MILLPYSRPWTQQPQEVADARAEWLRAYNFAQRGSDSANKAAPWTTGSLAYEAGLGGVGLRINAGGTATSGEMVPGISTAITVVMIAEKFGGISFSDFLFGEHASGAGAYNFGFYESAATGDLAFYVHNGTSGVQAVAVGDWRAGKGPQVWVGTFGGGDNNVRLYLNGAQVGSAAQTGSVQRNTSAILRSCYWQNGAPNFRLYAGAVSGRRYTAQEIAEQFGSAHSAYSALFEPQRIWVPVSTGTSGGTGSLSSTLGALTSSATGTVLISGTASKTLGTLTSSATGAVALTGTLSTTLGTLTLAAEGAGATVRTGELTKTLGALTSSATGTVAITGDVSKTLGALSLSAAGFSGGAISGELTATLGGLTLSAQGGNGLTGRRGRRTKTRFLPPAEPEVQEAPQETTGLVSEEAMTLLIQDQAGKAIRKARVSATKRRIEIQSHNVKALESSLMEWF